MRKKIRQKRKALYSSIYIPKANVILLDENNSAILKQKKKIDKLDNDNKIMAQKKKWNCILYCPGPDIPFGFNALSFLDLTIPPIPIENVFVSSGLNLPFSKGITVTSLRLGWYKGLLKNRVALENEYNFDMNALFITIIIINYKENVS